ncbi:MAG: hypothetical protein ACJAWS_002788 [Oleiphilaceae bacterium]|jgi:hypothetical protein
MIFAKVLHVAPLYFLLTSSTGHASVNKRKTSRRILIFYEDIR